MGDSRVGSYFSQLFGLFLLNFHRQKRKHVTNLAILSMPWLMVLLVSMLGFFLGPSFNQSFPAELNPISYSQRWSTSPFLEGAPATSVAPSPFEIYFATASSLDVGTLTSDPSDPATGFLSASVGETSTISGKRSPAFVAKTEEAMNEYFMDQWDEGLKTLGGVSYTQASTTALEVKFFTNDTSDGSLVAGPPASPLLPPLLDLIGNQWAKNVFPATAYIAHSIRDFPRNTIEASIDIIAASQMEPIGLALHVVIPFVITTIAADRALGMRQLMAMMGLRRSVYWIVNFCFSWGLSMICCLSLHIAGFVFQLRIITENSAVPLMTVWITWSVSIAAQTILIAPLIPNVMLATVVGWIYIFSLNETAIMVAFITSNTNMINPLVVVPSIAVHHVLDILSRGSTIGKPGIGWNAGVSFYLHCAWLVVSAVPMIGVGYLLDAKWDAFLSWSRYMIASAVHKPMKLFTRPDPSQEAVGAASRVGSIILALQLRFRGRAMAEAAEAARRVEAQGVKDGGVTPTAGRTFPPHPSVAAQIAMAERDGADDMDAVAIHHLHKTFRLPSGGSLHAVKDLSFTIPRGTCLAVLGPNGAGKCLGLDTPVLMHDESFRPVQDVKAGERVMGDDGTPRTVTSTTVGTDEMARVTLDKGAVFTCNMPHVLSLKMAAPITSDKRAVTHHTIERDAEGLVVKITPVATTHPTEEAAQAFIDELLASQSHQGAEVVHPDTTIDISVRDLLAEQHAGVRPQLMAYHPDGRTESMTIDRIGEGEYFGFTLDGNRRFIITENRIVTHNTMLAKAVAHHTKAAFIRVNGSEFIQKYLGDGPRMVRDVFRLARESSPSIVFVDEIDSIATKRFDANTGGDREVQRVLLELLNQMDGFDQTTNVKVIMATNRPDTLDPALTRPGRLDRKIECPLPDRRQKRLVFQVCTSKMTLEPDVDLEDLVVRPDKLSGADIHSVCLEAGMRAVRAKRMCVSMKDFDDAYKEVLRKETEADRFKFYQ